MMTHEELLQTQSNVEETQKIAKRPRGTPFQKGNPGGGRIKLTAEQKLIKQAAREVALSILTNHAPKAAKNITQLADKAKQEAVKLNANKDVLDRAGILPPIEKEQGKEGLNVTFILNSFKLEKNDPKRI